MTSSAVHTHPLSRDNYDAVAKAIRETQIFKHLDRETIRCIALMIQSELAASDPNFNRAAFYEACGFKPRFPKEDQTC